MCVCDSACMCALSTGRMIVFFFFFSFPLSSLSLFTRTTECWAHRSYTRPVRAFIPPSWYRDRMGQIFFVFSNPKINGDGEYLGPRTHRRRTPQNCLRRRFKPPAFSALGPTVWYRRTGKVADVNVVLSWESRGGVVGLDRCYNRWFLYPNIISYLKIINIKSNHNM